MDMVSPSLPRRRILRTASASTTTKPCLTSHPYVVFSSNGNLPRRPHFASSVMRIFSPSSPSSQSSLKYQKLSINSVRLSACSSKKEVLSGTSTTYGANAEKEFSLNRIQSKKKQNLSLKLLSWRGILADSKKVRSIILLNVITAVYASSIPVVKEAEAIMDPAAFAVMRFAISAIPFIPFVFQARDDTQTRNAGIELGFWVSLGYLMQALGLLTSDAGRASFISVFTVIVVPLLNGMLGATVPAYTWFGAIVSIVGVALLEASGSPPRVGDLLNFLSAVFFGVHVLRTEQVSRSTKQENFLPLLGNELCVVALLSTIWYALGRWINGIGRMNLASCTWRGILNCMIGFPWIPALYTGIFSTGLCLWAEMEAMREVSATETAIIYGLEPVWGAGFAWFFLGERLGIKGWIGALLVIGGSLIVQIFGSSPGKFGEGEDKNLNVDGLLVS